MNRKKRKEFLDNLEKLLVTNKISHGAIVCRVKAYYIRQNWDKTIKSSLKRIHIEDYKDTYPLSYDLIDRILNKHHNRYLWGRYISKVEQYKSIVSKDNKTMTDYIEVLSRRPLELIKRVPRLLLEFENRPDIFKKLEEEIKKLPKEALEELKERLELKVKKSQIQIYIYTIAFIEEQLGRAKKEAE